MTGAPQPTSSTPETTLAYLAGFFDGEGSIGIAGSSLSVRVVNTCRPILEHFRDAFGGAVVPVKKRDAKHRLCWLWRAYGDNAEEALKALSPYLREKGAQAYLGIHFRSLPKGAERARVQEALGLLKKTTYLQPGD